MKRMLKSFGFIVSIVLSSCDLATTSQTTSTSLSLSSTPSNQASSVSRYFYPVDITYDGLRIDETYLNSESIYTTIQGIKWGNGGTFSVEYNPVAGIGRCIDGDTTVFGFPQEVASLIESSPKRVRYLNIDTPETSGTPEKWGLLAKQYTCDSLLNAEAIMIQTDPGDKLLDRYGRLLGWVWVKRSLEQPFELLNYSIVRQGLAEVKYLFGAGETQATVYNNKTYTEWMYLAESLAKQDRFGMHSSLLDPYA
jgi:endonuclease YncB( thermonuclease family)